MRTWFITGISRGLGLALAKEALAQGDRVVGTVRQGAGPRIGTPDTLRILHLDLSDIASISSVMHKAFAAFDGLDVIVNNAGSGLFGPLEDTTADELSHLFDVDVLGPIAVIKGALPYLRAQGSGHVINITSIAARAPGAGATAYASAKAALEGLTAALSHEVRPHGIHVTAVAPGQFRTAFMSDTSIHKTTETGSPYAATVGTSLAGLEQTYNRQPGDPARAARALCALVASDNPPIHLLLGSDAYARAEQKIAETTQDMTRWKNLTCGTDFPPEPA